MTAFGVLGKAFYVSGLLVRKNITIFGDSSETNSDIKPFKKACYVISVIF